MEKGTGSGDKKTPTLILSSFSQAFVPCLKKEEQFLFATIFSPARCSNGSGPEGRAVQVLPHGTQHGPPLAVVKRELCQSPVSLSQGLRGFIYSILKADVNNRVFKIEELLVACFCTASNSGEHKERLV